MRTPVHLRSQTRTNNLGSWTMTAFSVIEKGGGAAFLIQQEKPLPHPTLYGKDGYSRTGWRSMNDKKSGHLSCSVRY